MYKTLSIVPALLLLVACGGGSTPAEPDSTSEVAVVPELDATEITEPVDTTGLPLLNGRFIDGAPVDGLHFQTASISGVTSEGGQYQYREGESVTFSLGDIELPAVGADSIVSALDVFETTDALDVSVVNLNRLLITLDEDGEIDNGINIPDIATLSATGIQLDFADRGFSTLVINLLANSGAVTSDLVPAPGAITAFVNAIDTYSLEKTSCSTTHESIGSQAAFNTVSHGVAGTLTVVDDCTLIVSDFVYDGLGPSVLFYAGNDRDYFSGAVFYFPFRLHGNRFEGDSLRLKIPEGQSLDDFDSLSVWCFDFNVSFGDAQLPAPL